MFSIENLLSNKYTAQNAAGKNRDQLDSIISESRRGSGGGGTTDLSEMNSFAGKRDCHTLYLELSTAAAAAQSAVTDDARPSTGGDREASTVDISRITETPHSKNFMTTVRDSREREGSESIADIRLPGGSQSKMTAQVMMDDDGGGEKLVRIDEGRFSGRKRRSSYGESESDSSSEQGTSYIHSYKHASL
jgi:hypothetical protein